MANTITVEVLAETRKMREGVQQVGKQLGGLQRIGKSVGPHLKAALAADIIRDGVTAVVDSVKGAYDTVKQQGVLAAQTEAVLKSTGNAANVSADDIVALSEAIEGKSMIDAEAMTSGQNLLLTFTNIKNAAGDGNDIFNQTTQTMADMATAMGTDPKQAALQLGKALNDPVKGVSALGRVGVSFTAQQKEQIKTLVESGKTMDAQKLILGELNKEFGGSAAASANTFEGALFQIKDTLDGVLEDGIKALMPYLQQFADYLAANLPGAIETVKTKFNEITTALEPVGAALATFVGFLRDNPATVKAFAITLGILGGVVGVVTLAQWAWNVAMLANPIGLIILGIAALVAAIVWVVTNWDVVTAATSRAWQWIKDAVMRGVNAVNGVIRQVIGAVVGFFRGAWEAVVNAHKKAFSVIVGVVRSQINAVKSVINTVIGWVRKFIDANLKAIALIARTAFNLFRTYIVGPVNAVRSTVTTIVYRIRDSVRSAFYSAADTGRNAFYRLRDSVRNAIGSVMATVSGLRGRIVGALSSVASWLYNAGYNLIRGFVSGIRGSIGSAVSAAIDVARSAVNSAKSALGIRSPSRVFAGLGEQVGAGLVQGIRGTLNDAAGAASALAGTVADHFTVPEQTITVGYRANLDSLTGVAGRAPVTNNYYLDVGVPLGTSRAEVGREIVDAIRAYDRLRGATA